MAFACRMCGHGHAQISTGDHCKLDCRPRSSYQAQIQVPWSLKHLDIGRTSFRKQIKWEGKCLFRMTKEIPRNPKFYKVNTTNIQKICIFSD